MITLLIDVGNTRLKWGLAGPDGAHRVRALAYRENLDAVLEELLESMPSAPGRIRACSVTRSEVAAKIDEVAQRTWGLQPEWAEVQALSGGVTNAYTEVHRLGVDRWLAILAAYKLARAAAVVVDVGTAATIDAVLENGQHLGGMILPGTELMSESLFAQTEQIIAPASALRDPENLLEFFASDTDLAVQNGGLAALCGAIEFSMKVIAARDQGAQLFLTGGGASSLLPYLAKPWVHRPALVLDGLCLSAGKGGAV